MNHNLRSRSLSILLVLVLAVVSACRCTDCGPSAACPATLSAADQAGIHQNSQTWLAAVRAANWSAAAATYTADAMLLPPNMPAVQGRDAIRQFLAGFPRIVSIDLEQVETGGCCDVAYVRGTYRMSYELPGAGVVSESGKYIEIRRKQPDGAWLKLHDMFSADAPPR